MSGYIVAADDAGLVTSEAVVPRSAINSRVSGDTIWIELSISRPVQEAMTGAAEVAAGVRVARTYGGFRSRLRNGEDGGAFLAAAFRHCI